jgi:hypothetical protein
LRKAQGIRDKKREEEKTISKKSNTDPNTQREKEPRVIIIHQFSEHRNEEEEA